MKTYNITIQVDGNFTKHKTIEGNDDLTKDHCLKMVLDELSETELLDHPDTWKCEIKIKEI